MFESQCSRHYRKVVLLYTSLDGTFVQLVDSMGRRFSGDVVDICDNTICIQNPDTGESITANVNPIDGLENLLKEKDLDLEKLAVLVNVKKELYREIRKNLPKEVKAEVVEALLDSVLEKKEISRSEFLSIIEKSYPISDLIQNSLTAFIENILNRVFHDASIHVDLSINPSSLDNYKDIEKFLRPDKFRVDFSINF